jgi:hypothetical protein
LKISTRPRQANSIPTGAICIVGPADRPEEILKEVIYEGMMKGLLQGVGNGKKGETDAEIHDGIVLRELFLGPKY